MSEHDDIARELRATRAEPTPEFARELDERAAGWLREKPRRRMPWPRVAVPAVAAAAVAAIVIALAVSGEGDNGSELGVAVVRDGGAVDALGSGGGGSQLELEREAAPSAAEGGFAAPRSPRVEQGEPVVVRYFFTAPTEGTVELDGREASLELPAGAGRVEISTEDLGAGTHVVQIKVPAAPLYRARIEIRD